MVQGSGIGGVNFVMIDFGLAVESQRWREEWRATNIAGDPRYWSPATWLNFAYGPQYLDSHPDAGLRRQYEARLDHHAFGVLVLEVFFALWDGEPSGLEAMTQARSAWRTYWTRAYGFFQRFHGDGGQGFVQLRKD